MAEALPVDHHAVTEPVELGVALVQLKPAVAATELAEKDDHLIASGVDELLDLHPPLGVPGRGPSLGVGHDCLVPALDPAVRQIRPIPFDVRSTERQAV